MEDITPTLEAGALRIDGYGVDGITVNGRIYTDAITLIGADVAPVPNLTYAALRVHDTYTPFIQASGASIVLVGTGASAFFIAPSLRRTLQQSHGLTLEAMDTGAACRTFNVLSSEARPVVALLLPPTMSAHQEAAHAS